MKTRMSAAILLGFSSTAFAQVEDLQTTYARSPGECGTPAKLITISQGMIEGQGFSCAISNEHPAGTGVWAYDASCTIDGKSVSGKMPMAVAMNADPEYFSIGLPGSDDWIDIHPCKSANQ